MGEQAELTRLGRDILLGARNELYLAMPYLDASLCALSLSDGAGVTPALATDGEALYYDPHYLADRFLRGPAAVNRAYLHVVLHCLLRHIGKAAGREPRLWDIACDTAVESILDSLDYPCLAAAQNPAKRKFYGQCRQELKVLTAEGVYRRLLRARLSEYELAALARVFFQDDHGLWSPREREKKERTERQDRQWRERSERSRTALETVLAGQAEGAGAVLEQVRVSAREGVDYRAFLRRFAAPREVLGVDGDAFDYGYYAYGLSLYGSLPLIEPPETREEKRVEQLVIAVDTSLSTSGALVREFLRCTYAILRSSDSFTRRLDVRVIQCDDRVRADVPIRSREELEDYMADLRLSGGSATDFRPVFEHVAALREKGELTRLRGLIYFTDGMGVYPERRPPYETAFVLLGEPPLSFPTPPWAIRLVLEAEDLERTAEAMDWEEPAEDMPEL